LSRPFPEQCPEQTVSSQQVFSCCLATGEKHVKPQCAYPNDKVYYQLAVVDWCLSTTQASVTIRAPLCNSNSQDGFADDQIRDCFNITSTPDRKMDLIAAFHPSDQDRPHGYQRRTSSQADLNAGVLTERESGSSTDEGVIAFHAISMLFFWMILAPAGIFVRIIHQQSS
jgi:hypothetical protein